MKFFKSIYHPRIKLLGIAGLLYKDGGVDYFIDSELGPRSNILLLSNSVKYYASDIKLGVDEKRVIAEKAKKELESMGLKVDFR